MNKNLNMTVYGPHEFLFEELAAPYAFRTEQSWRTDSFKFDRFKLPGEVIRSEFGEGNVRSIFKGETYVGSISFTARVANFALAGSSKAELQKLMRSFKRRIPEMNEPEKGRILVDFWYLTGTGPTYLEREITAPAWDEIEVNYDTKTRKSLEKLLFDFTPAQGGQLILWQGNPGTGKTFALRSLCDAWKEWCEVSYVVDPESFFGTSAYMMQLVGNSNDEYADEELNTSKEWRLFILEDTGELLSETAKAETGQGLSRLLNLVDGFVGQGMKILVLITSNEAIERLHPAVARPGRCAAIIPFEQLSAKEAQEWAEYHGIKLPSKKPYKLAELYAIKNGFTNQPAGDLSSVIGFRVPA